MRCIGNSRETRAVRRCCFCTAVLVPAPRRSAASVFIAGLIGAVIAAAAVIAIMRFAPEKMGLAAAGAPAPAATPDLTPRLADLAARLEDGRLDLDRLRTLDDDAARAALTEVKGVGRFTADGVLMLSLRRRDVWPAADLAFRRAVERVWGLGPPASVNQVDSLGERFRPWRTLAAVYLYSSVEP